MTTANETAIEASSPHTALSRAHEETRTCTRKDRAIWPVPNCQPGITKVSQSNCLSISQHRSDCASEGPPPTRHIRNCDYRALHLGRSRVVHRRRAPCYGARVMCVVARVAGAKDCRFQSGFEPQRCRRYRGARLRRLSRSLSQSAYSGSSSSRISLRAPR